MPPHLGTLCPNALEPGRNPRGPSAATGSASAARSVDRAVLRRPELLATRPALLGFGLFG
jgi:hypothetical protein